MPIHGDLEKILIELFLLPGDIGHGGAAIQPVAIHGGIVWSIQRRLVPPLLQGSAGKAAASVVWPWPTSIDLKQYAGMRKSHL